MLINRVQTSEDIQKIIKKIFWSLLMKMGVPIEVAQKSSRNYGEGHMGYLFENIEKMDIQEERRKTADAIKKAEESENRAKEAENLLKTAENRAKEVENHLKAAENYAKVSDDMLTKMVSIVIQEKKAENHTKEEVVQILKEKYHLAERAEEMVRRFW